MWFRRFRFSLNRPQRWQPLSKNIIGSKTHPHWCYLENSYIFILWQVNLRVWWLYGFANALKQILTFPRSPSIYFFRRRDLTRIALLWLSWYRIRIKMSLSWMNRFNFFLKLFNCVLATDKSIWYREKFEKWDTI